EFRRVLFRSSKVGKDVLGFLTAADAETLADDLQSQFMGPWSRYLRGREELSPRPWWDTREAVDLLAAAQALDTAGTALTTWSTQLANADEVPDGVALARRFGMPLMPKALAP